MQLARVRLPHSGQTICKYLPRVCSGLGSAGCTETPYVRQGAYVLTGKTRTTHRKLWGLVEPPGHVFNTWLCGKVQALVSLPRAG